LPLEILPAAAAVVAPCMPLDRLLQFHMPASQGKHVETTAAKGTTTALLLPDNWVRPLE
jgi:hypothetical protein